MSGRMHLRWLAAASLLCAAARPALADGALMTKEEWNHFLLVAVSVILVGLLGSILLIRLLISLARRATEKAAEPSVPVARVVLDRDKP